jgi:hypothetical protein
VIQVCDADRNAPRPDWVLGIALYPICWLYNHVPGADFRDLVDAPIRIMVGDAVTMTAAATLAAR